MGGDWGEELQSLPTYRSEKAKLTEAEIALRKSEISRKRKSQSDKRLEDEVRSYPVSLSFRFVLAVPFLGADLFANPPTLPQKTETINRLLKKQVGKTTGKSKGKSKLSSTTTNNQSGGGTEDGDDAPGATPAFVAPPAIPTTSRWVSSIKSGEYSVVLALPPGPPMRRELGGGEAPKEPVYPGPRPPLKTRRLARA